MLGAIAHSIGAHNLWLYPDGTAYWAQENTLFIADVHLGKSGHFRAFGIPTPKGIHTHAMRLLRNAFARHDAAQIIFLGDLFHNLQNTETRDLLDLMEEFAEHSFVLVKGNHDVDVPEHSALKVTDRLTVGPFLCLHEPPGSNFDRNTPFDLDHIQARYTKSFLLCGHLHPGAILRGKGRGRIKMKAFFFNDHLGVLPAFGPFTGAHALQVEGQYYGIAEGRIISLF